MVPEFIQSEKECILCGNREARILNEPLRLVQCRRCRFIFRDQGMQEKHYETTDNYRERMTRKGRVEARQRDTRHQLEIITKVIPAQGRWLDIGCNDGFFLQEAKKSGFQVYGCEPNREMCSFAREQGLEIIEGTFDTAFDAFQKNAPYDVISLFHVLEHLNDPVAELQKVFSLLGDNGVLIVEVPDFEAPLQKIYGDESPWCCEEHLLYFTRTSLTRLLNMAGFSVLFSHRRSWDEFQRHWWENLHRLPVFTAIFRLARAVRKILKKVLHVDDDNFIAVESVNVTQENIDDPILQKGAKLFGQVNYYFNRGDHLMVICQKRKQGA